MRCVHVMLAFLLAQLANTPAKGDSMLQETVREAVGTVRVPEAASVHRDNPACGVDTSRLAHIGTYPSTVRAIGKLFGEKPSATLFVAEGNRVIEDCGIRHLCGKLWPALSADEHASCGAVCVRTAPGATLRDVRLSDRSGSGWVTLMPDQARLGLPDLSTGDRSGWRDVSAARDDAGRWFVCGIGTNWSGDQTATKSLSVGYSAPAASR